MSVAVRHIKVYKRRSTIARRCGRTGCRRPATVRYVLVTPGGLEVPVVACAACAAAVGAIERKDSPCRTPIS